jgi:beta-lactamase class A
MKMVACLILATAHLFAAQSPEWSRPDERLQRLINDAVAKTLHQFASNQLQSNQISVTLVNLRATPPARATFRGDAVLYPASVVKLFYLAAAHRWLEDGRLKEGAELNRALRDMIVDSSNDATHYVVDALTGTSSGPELPDDEMKSWGERRNGVNRYFASLGYRGVNANQKPWCEGPYGRDRIWVGLNYTNRNALTTEATARLMTEIAREQCVTPARSRQMKALLERDLTKASADLDDQAWFTGRALPNNARLFSKAGWTSTTRHDAAYLELPDERRFVLVIFTTGRNHANNREIIPFIARQIIAGL